MAKIIDDTPKPTMKDRAQKVVDGVQGGQVVGQSDRIGAYPASRTFAPADLAATIYQCLGVDPATEVLDRLNRPIRLCNGEPIAPLFDRSRTA